MRSVCFTEDGKPELIEIPKPKLLSPNDVMIRVKYCAICGDERGYVDGKLRGDARIMPLGHEISGTIEAIGRNVLYKNLSVGDRVTGNYANYCGRCYYCETGRRQLCRNAVWHMNCMAEYVVWNERQCYKIPESVSMEQACLTEPLTCCIRAMEEAGVTTGSRVAIFGAGGIGLMMLQLAKLSGAAEVMVIEPIAARRKFARELGADLVLDPCRDNIYKEGALFSKSYGFDVVFEASGSTDAVQPALGITGSGGMLILFSLYKGDYNHSLNLSVFFFIDISIK
ncbi:MAG: alcohol dehydrogenase catalytic domain-containing protein [Lachnospiraceae bacterium]|nr:alcohol dehydrogenase catalytic domain-containing protein [Lachnospiraceae bacterium]